MPAASFVGFSGTPGDISVGATSAETGILLGDMDYTHDNPRVDFFDRYGGIIGVARNHNAMLTLNINGEMKDIDAGLNVASFTAAATIANEEFFAASVSTYNTLDYANAPTLLDSVSGSQPRGGARTVSLSYFRPIGLQTS